MAVVYQHIRKDTGDVFYVGIGKSLKRAFFKHSRNRYWKFIVNKVGYDVEIVYSDLTWNLACNMEKNLIAAYGRNDLGTGTLVNLNEGGGSGDSSYMNNDYVKAKSLNSRRVSGDLNKWISAGQSTESRLKASKSCYKPIVQKTKEGILVREWSSIKEATQTLKNSSIINCLRGYYKYAGGFIWEYKK